MADFGVYDVLRKLVEGQPLYWGEDYEAALAAIDKAFGVETVAPPEVPAQSGGVPVSAEVAAGAQSAAVPVVQAPDPVAAAQVASQPVPESDPVPVPEVPTFLQPPTDDSPTAGLPTE